MLRPSLSDPALLKAVLEPLLQDFQFWFKRTRELLEQEHLAFLEGQAQSSLLARVRKTQQQVTVAQSLLEATDGESSIEMAVLMPWHQLVLECWQVTTRFRRQQADPGSSGLGLGSWSAANLSSAVENGYGQSEGNGYSHGQSHDSDSGSSSSHKAA